MQSSVVSGVDGTLAGFGASADREAKLQALAAGSLKGKDAAARVAQEFEAMFLAQMLEQMFSGVKLGTALGEESAESEIYTSYMMNEYGKIISASGGIGVADYVQRELLRLQEASQ